MLKKKRKKSRENVCVDRQGLDWKQPFKNLHKNDFQPITLYPPEKINLVSELNKFNTKAFITFLFI